MKTKQWISPLLLFASLLLMAAPLLAGSGPALKLSTDKKEYIQGEDLNISLEADKDCRVVLIYITASGDTVRILPSGTGPDGRIIGGKQYRTPATGEDRGLYISEPFGKEHIIAYATDKDLPPITSEEVGNGLYLIPGGEKAVDRLLPDAVKAVWELETFPKDERGRFRNSRPEDPIHMTGSAGHSEDKNGEGLK
ncbi:DUF4384 domain-containing protein [Maridesulfovibrio sp. FT414]|uniref:DUF4384 domain-containing protein n=1 Tax=Maridesulfovibrio sp. FT414 TaxID=2979469 RepID=UPI003D8056FB